MALRARITCVPGLEALVARECTALGIGFHSVVRGVVTANVTTQQLYAANVLLRCASAVHVEAASFKAKSFPELEARVKKLKTQELAPWLGAGARSSPEVEIDVIHVSSSRSALYHKRGIAERITRFLEPAGAQPGAKASTTPQKAQRGGSAPAKLLLRIEVKSDVVTVLVDSSGEPLHERGWLAAAPTLQLLVLVSCTTLY